MKKRVIIMGAGDSVRREIENGLWDKIKGEEIWSLNSVFKVMPYLPTAQLWVDVKFYEKEVSNLQKLQEQTISLVSNQHLLGIS